ncbi:GMC family oxidoreductase [Aggregicoccus sp. 17bor-14]|uniref:GMC oxidoreductase n=1 Tax=Myxococcaceae TaxID=31 RepID=UPI00129CB878|nr:MULTISPECIES: GMC family oxidoreductase [Myxococcaceae]MBF5044540.1 GMC family oxidoreductase [Simulacricoccus sp. 17bor-14]MRI90285.1 GMC family oxidoreductase [Aggregicoccus sp. 17bor-14]
MAFDYDVLIIGSGFGGSVSALRLTEKGYRVGVLEAGRRYTRDSFPKTNWDAKNFLWMPALGMRGFQRMTLLKDILVLSGAGVGGGSLVYANTLYEPLEPYYRDRQWAHITDWREELAPHYAQAKRMLGVTETPFTTPADRVMQHVAKELGVEGSYHATPVGVFFGKPGERVKDPYFGGEGPDRVGCTRCGGCMVGCRVGAKNTLDQNYLYLAEKRGAQVHPEREVVDVRPLPEGGYEVVTRRPGAWRDAQERTFRAEQVVFSAGALGTLKLLLQLRAAGRLPALSPRLGELTRTNSEAIVGASAGGHDTDYSDGVAITSSIHPDANTHIEPVRYPRGSNLMGMLSTLMVDGGGRVPRWLRFVGTILRHPLSFLRSLSVRRWSEKSIILLVMQSHDNSLRLRLKRGLFGAKLTTEQGHGEPNPTWIPVANEAARIAAKKMGGRAYGSWFEALFNVPTTAHIIGGCPIGDSRETGVIDPYHRVYGHAGLHVVDGSAVTANLGVNPSLSITALAERALSFWPNKGEADLRPPLGSPYRRLAPVPPQRPALPPSAPAALPAAAQG